jgi:hypothetical protein
LYWTLRQSIVLHPLHLGSLLPSVFLNILYCLSCTSLPSDCILTYMQHLAWGIFHLLCLEFLSSLLSRICILDPNSRADFDIFLLTYLLVDSFIILKLFILFSKPIFP